MPWVYLVIAGVFEVVWASLLKLSEGFTRPGYSVATVIGMIVSFWFLAQATRTLPIGTAYAIWTGIGAVGAVLVGVAFYREPMTLLRGLFLLLVIAGILGLKATA